jgi:hypothetical protein
LLQHFCTIFYGLLPNALAAVRATLFMSIIFFKTIEACLRMAKFSMEEAVVISTPTNIPLNSIVKVARKYSADASLGTIA